MTDIKKHFIGHEGYEPKPYTDTTGNISIGIGRNLKANPLSEDEVELLFNNDIKRTEKGLDAYLPWWRTLDDTRRLIILDMAFNLGVHGLLGFRNTLAEVQRGDYVAASKRMLLSRWAKQVGRRARNLSEMMRTGVHFYP